MAGHQEPVMMHRRGSSGLSATLAAAGLADPGILALAQEADSLVYHSQMAQEGASPHTIPRAQSTAAHRTFGPPAAHSTSPRHHRISPSPGAKPVVLPTAGTGYAGRTSPIPGKGPSPIYGSKRTVSNSYVLSRGNSRGNSSAGNKVGSAAPSRNCSGAGHKGDEPRDEPRSGSSAGHKPYVSAAVSAFNAAARSGSSTLPRSRNTSNTGHAVGSSGPSCNNSSAGARRPGGVSAFPARAGAAVGSRTPSSGVSAFAAASGAGGIPPSKVVLHSTFSIGQDEAMARSASMGPSSGGAAPTPASIGAFPNTLHRRTASLPCWPADSTAVSTAASAMEEELEAAFVAAVASGEHFSSDDGLEITLASPPAAINAAGSGTSVPSMVSTLERAHLAGACEVECAAAAAAAAAAGLYSQPRNEPAHSDVVTVAVSHKSSEEHEMSGTHSSSLVIGGSVKTASNSGSAASRSFDGDSPVARPGPGRNSSSRSSSISSSSSSAAATPKANSVSSAASSVFVAKPREAASLLQTDEYSTTNTAANPSLYNTAQGSINMMYQPVADQPTDALDALAPAQPSAVHTRRD
ncbi:hypothetical protein COO60DRAFT_282781 [Scenedesmus sp. NREL 46B-D3]|nr:hypothetical protein COO60DRAFT_282781 [Scenedesmus sp. NREL 46B-D3]